TNLFNYLCGGFISRQGFVVSLESFQRLSSAKVKAPTQFGIRAAGRNLLTGHEMFECGPLLAGNARDLALRVKRLRLDQARLRRVRNLRGCLRFFGGGVEPIKTSQRERQLNARACFGTAVLHFHCSRYRLAIKFLSFVESFTPPLNIAKCNQVYSDAAGMIDRPRHFKRAPKVALRRRGVAYSQTQIAKIAEPFNQFLSQAGLFINLKRV